jgi:hypothetical protein
MLWTLPLADKTHQKKSTQYIDVQSCIMTVKEIIKSENIFKQEGINNPKGSLLG